MTTAKLAQVTHLLAVVAGVLTIISGALVLPPFSVPALIPASMGVVVTVLVYISNQIPALGSTSPNPPAASPPTS